MTIQDIIAAFSSAGVPEPKNDARILASYFLSLPQSKLLTLEIDKAQLDSLPGFDELKTAANYRISRKPLQYIIGQWDFCGLTFKVNEHCLIPRPDTEIIVEQALNYLKSTKIPSPIMLDLCTGSGNIAAAAAHFCQDLSVDCVELDPCTAELARENVQNLNLTDRVKVHTIDLCSFVPAEGKTYNIITSNPPYVTAEEMTTLEPELTFEPRIALTDESNGLTLIEKIVSRYRDYLAPNGIMLIEHGAAQADAVIGIVRKNNMVGKTLYDYSRNPRAVLIRHG